MSRLRLLVAALLAFVLVGCGSAAIGAARDLEPGAPAGGRAALTAALDEITAAGPSVAVTVVDNTTGSTFSYAAGEPMETASIVKVEILAALLLRAQETGTPLDARQRALVETMIRDSSDDAASELWWEIGGPEGLASVSERLGLTSTVGGDDGWWGWTTTTAADQAQLISALISPESALAADSQDQILALMGSVRDDQAWGVSAAAAGGETVQVKNGWMSDSALDPATTINSIGRITGDGTDLTVVVLTGGSPDESTGIQLVEHVASLSRTTLAW
jgi:hypothetical protein